MFESCNIFHQSLVWRNVIVTLVFSGSIRRNRKQVFCVQVQPAANRRPIPAKHCVPSPSEPKVAGKSSHGSAGRSAGAKDVNNSSGGLIERALSLVHEGQLTAGVAIKLFGIPRSTFYKKLSMTHPRQQQQQQLQADNAFDGSETFGEYFSSSNNEWDTAELNCGTYFVNQ
jgi:hypothetical protein